MYINGINYTREFLEKEKYFKFIEQIETRYNNLLYNYHSDIMYEEDANNNADISENEYIDLENINENESENDNSKEKTLLNEKEEKKLLYFLNYFKSMIFLDLIINDKIFKNFQDRMNYIIEMTSKDENEIEEINFNELEKLEEIEEELKKEFFIIFSKEEEENLKVQNKIEKNNLDEEILEDEKDNEDNENSEKLEEENKKKKKIKRISYESRNKLLKNTLKKIYKYRDEIKQKILKNELTVKEYEKYIKNITKLIININPTQYWFKKQKEIIENELKNNKNIKKINNNIDCLYICKCCYNEKGQNTCLNSLNYELKELKKILDIIVMFNIRLIIKYVKIYNNKVPSKLSFNDLKNIGIIGFIESTYKFNPFKNFKLSTYTTWWIKQNIIKNINQLRNSIVLPLYYTKIISKIEKYKKEYESNPDIQKKYKNFYEYIEKEFGINRKKIKKLEKYIQTTNSISLNGIKSGDEGDDENTNFEDFIVANLTTLDGNNNILDELEKEEIIKLLKEFINDPKYFNNKERYLIINSNSLFTDDVKTIESLAIKLDRTKERLRQLQVEIYNKIAELFPLYIKEKFKENKNKDKENE